MKLCRCLSLKDLYVAICKYVSVFQLEINRSDNYLEFLSISLILQISIVYNYLYKKFTHS